MKRNILFYTLMLAHNLIHSQNILSNGGFEDGESGFPTQLNQGEKLTNWELFKEKNPVDWFYYDQNSPNLPNNVNDPNAGKFNCFFYENPFYTFGNLPANEEIQTYEQIACFGQIHFRYNPYSPYNSETGQFLNGFLQTINVIGEVMQTHEPIITNGNNSFHAGLNHFVGIGNIKAGFRGIQQGLPEKVKEGRYRLSFWFSTHTKYQTTKLEFYLSKHKDQTHYKIATFLVEEDAYTHNSSTFAVQPGKWKRIFYYIDIPENKADKYDWIQIVQNGCDPNGYPFESQYILLDDIDFRKDECEDDDIIINNYNFQTYGLPENVNARNSIVASQSVNVLDNTEVYFKAGNIIIMGDGFNVQRGAIFSASIAPCPSSAHFTNNIPDSYSQEYELFAFPENNIFDNKIIPNPNNGTFYLQLQNQSDFVATLSLSDITGKILFSNNYESLIGKQFDFSFLSNGIYFITITQGEMKYNLKLVKN